MIPDKVNKQDLEKRVKSLVHSLRYNKGYVCSIDILMGLDYLSKTDYENWRFGKVDYLERVCKVNLHKLTLINSLMRKYSRELKLKESFTVYKKYGKGAKHILRFSKSGLENIEEAYATHHVDVTRISELKNNASVQQPV